MKKLSSHSIVSRVIVLVLVAIVGLAGAAFGASAEETFYNRFFAQSHTVKVPASALDADGTAVVYFPVDGLRGVTLELDLSAVGPGTYTLQLPSMSPIITANLDGTGLEVTRRELATRLAAPGEEQSVFCRNNDGLGGSVGMANVPAVSSTGATVMLSVEIGNDGLMHPGQEVIASCGLGAVSTPPVILNALNGDVSSAHVAQAANTEKVWCISWPSKDCKKRNCNSQSCAVTLASVIELASDLGVTIPGGKTAAQAVAWLSEELGISVGGYCGQVSFLGLISVGCQCVMHTF